MVWGFNLGFLLFLIASYSIFLGFLLLLLVLNFFLSLGFYILDLFYGTRQWKAYAFNPSNWEAEVVDF